jgi:hypothetical protein
MFRGILDPLLSTQGLLCVTLFYFHQMETLPLQLLPQHTLFLTLFLYLARNMIWQQYINLPSDGIL